MVYKLPLDNEKFNNGLPSFFVRKINRHCLDNKIKNILVVGLTYKDGSYLLTESQSYSIALKLSKKLNVFYFDPDVLSTEKELNLHEFNTESKINGDLLLLNCSRDNKKSEMAKKILIDKNIKFFNFEIWE